MLRPTSIHPSIKRPSRMITKKLSKFIACFAHKMSEIMTKSPIKIYPSPKRCLKISFLISLFLTFVKLLCCWLQLHKCVGLIIQNMNIESTGIIWEYRQDCELTLCLALSPNMVCVFVCLLCVSRLATPWLLSSVWIHRWSYSPNGRSGSQTAPWALDRRVTLRSHRVRQ